jgi:hypothetical protein
MDLKYQSPAMLTVAQHDHHERHNPFSGKYGILLFGFQAINSLELHFSLCDKLQTT